MSKKNQEKHDTGISLWSPEQGRSIEIPYSADRIFFTSDEHYAHENILKYTYRGYADLDEMETDLLNKHNEVIPARGALWIDLGDIVFGHRGRDCCNNLHVLRRVVKKSNGERKFLIRGNHDYMPAEKYHECGFDEIFNKGEILTLNFGGRVIQLSHRPPVLNKNDPYDCRNLNVEDVRKKREAMIHERELIADIGTYKTPMLYIDASTCPTGCEHGLQDMETITQSFICGHVHQLFRCYAKGAIVNVGVDVWNGYPVSLARILSEIDNFSAVKLKGDSG